MITQAELLSGFSDTKLQFNPEIFKKSDEEIIECLKNVILSCQRSRTFTIKVEKFEVIEKYDEIMHMLYEYTEDNLSKNRIKDNPYAYINLKDTDMKLLVVHYYISIYEKSEFKEKRLKVLIAVPRIVDKYYFKINGIYYSPIYQIVEGSTYNNSTSRSKKPFVTLRSVFMPIRVFRDNTQFLTTVQKTAVDCVYYSSMIFNKFLPVMKYILARYGLLGTLSLFHINHLIISQEPVIDDETYCFITKGLLYIQVPKYLYDNSTIIQSLCYTIVTSVNKYKAVTYDEIFTTDFWIKSLGSEFNNFSIEKGLSILDSLEGVYDIITQENIRLPEHKKDSVYKILAWMVGEFNELKLKDNLDLGMKRIRWAEYVAALYAMKLSVGIYRISDIGKKAKLSTIEKAIKTAPTFLLGAIVSCKFIRYCDLVNDMDSLLATRFTYKGLAGIGEKNNSVPEAMRFVHPSQLGRLDIDSSSDQDPGVSGTLCPMIKLYDNFFSDYVEPDGWDAEMFKLMNEYRELINLKETISFNRAALGKPDPKEIDVDEALSTGNMIQALKFVTEEEKVEFIAGENDMLVFTI